MSVLKLVQDGICEELKLRLLHYEKHLFLQLLRLLSLAEQGNLAACGPLKSCNQLAESGFAATVSAHQTDDFMRANGKIYV